MVEVTPPPFRNGLSKLVAIHFPAKWVAVYANVARSPSNISTTPFATLTISMSPYGTTSLIPGAPTSYKIPQDDVTWDSVVAGQNFLHTTHANDNMQGTKLFRLESGKKYTGSVVSTITDVPTCPGGIVVNVFFYFLRLVKGQTISFTETGTGISLPNLTAFGTISYTLPSVPAVPPPTRSDNFNFTG